MRLLFADCWVDNACVPNGIVFRNLAEKKIFRNCWLSGNSGQNCTSLIKTRWKLVFKIIVFLAGKPMWFVYYSECQPFKYFLDRFHSVVLTQVFEILRERGGRQGDPWDLLDTTVCLKAWKVLRGLGTLTKWGHKFWFFSVTSGERIFLTVHEAGPT